MGIHSMSVGSTPHIDELLAAIANPTRLRLVQTLSHPGTCRELSHRLHLPESRIRYHLTVLRRTGFIDVVPGDEGVSRGLAYQQVSMAIETLTRALAGEGRPPVVSIVARSGTGKTTFLKKLLPELKKRGLRVGVVKHHAHDTPFDLPGKDTYTLTEAGADVVVGACPVQVVVFRQEDGASDLDRVIDQHLSDTDLVLTEGFKQGSYPKIEVHRASLNRALLCEPAELIALVSDENLDIPVPQFRLDDASSVANLLVNWLRGNRRD